MQVIKLNGGHLTFNGRVHGSLFLEITKTFNDFNANIAFTLARKSLHVKLIISYSIALTSFHGLYLRPCLMKVRDICSRKLACFACLV